MSPGITSTQNSRIKFAISLQKASARKKEQLFIIEGLREIRLALLAGYKIHSLFVCTEITLKNREDSYGHGVRSPAPGRDDIADIIREQAPVMETTSGVFRKLAYREKSDGLVAIAHQKRFVLEDIKLGDNPLVLVAESVEKPGNLGAMLRTADAAGLDAVLICDPTTDLFNPNVVRSSLGTLFTTRIACCTSKEAVDWLKIRNIRIYTTALTASQSYHQVDYTGPAAIVSGAEATGVSGIWEDNSDAKIIIPMFGMVDSMNVSAATAVVLYEALRQRGFSSGKSDDK
jgi:RNA methyltransferase, TrmH family